MSKVIVFYPREFNVWTKFERKLEKILFNISDYSLLSIEDPRGFTERYCKEKGIAFLTEFSFSESNATHAIIFDDGEEFQEETRLAQEKAIPTRRIIIPITRVINIDKDPPSKYGLKYEYIGRSLHRKKHLPNWSNPYSLFGFLDADEERPTREDVIRKFAYGFERDNLPTNLKKTDTLVLMGKRLGCHCKPEACHGDVIAEYLNSWDDGK